MISETKHWNNRFRWLCRDGGSVLHIRLEGELDVLSIRLGSAALREALGERPQTIVLDMSEVSFIDSSGLGLLIRAKREIEERGGRLIVSRLSTAAKRFIDLARLNEWFDPVDALADDTPSQTSPCPVCDGKLLPPTLSCDRCAWPNDHGE